MRTREEIQSDIDGLRGMIESANSEIEDLERDINYAYDKKAELEAELAELDTEAGEDE
ncbi:hypothetical protein QPL77_14640 [Bacillus pumilus]|uniref:hypothetical protein n=1 Tax=Bacillus pumilus TaxID=1408 RepID=UPI00253F6E68|nr:hypothetical protein [Bacillus pumilus]WIG31212.1 hypothetical protein QPL77_14640 [Bacillus pumilus]